MKKNPAAPVPPVPQRGVARVISKMGIGSRTQAAVWVREGRVRVKDNVVRGTGTAVIQGRAGLPDNRQETTPMRAVSMLNKPRGLVTTTRDDRGRDTVYKCFE